MFSTHFENITDPRSNVNKKHNLLDVLFLVIVALASGAEGWSDIKMFGDEKLHWLRKYRAFENGIPVDDTISRIFQRLDTAQVAQALQSWFAEMKSTMGKQHIAIDGKALRHSFQEASDKTTMLHLVTAYSVEHGLVMNQMRCKNKKNEIKTVENFLELLDLTDATVTADAMHTHANTANIIHRKGGNYLLPVKGNQGLLLKESEAYLHKIRREAPELIANGTFEEVNGDHGRIETRTYVQVPISDWFKTNEIWNGLSTLIEVTRSRESEKGKVTSCIYYVTSLECSAQEIAKLIRGHWRIENSQHYVLDVAFKEDESRVRKDNSAENLAGLRRTALNILKEAPNKFKKVSMRRRIKAAGWNDDTRAELLFGEII